MEDGLTCFKEMKLLVLVMLKLETLKVVQDVTVLFELDKSSLLLDDLLPYSTLKRSHKCQVWHPNLSISAIDPSWQLN